MIAKHGKNSARDCAQGGRGTCEKSTKRKCFVFCVYSVEQFAKQRLVHNGVKHDDGHNGNRKKRVT